MKLLKWIVIDVDWKDVTILFFPWKRLWTEIKINSSQTQNEQELTRAGLTTPIHSQEQNTVCALLKTKYVWNLFTYLIFINEKLSKPYGRNVSIC